MKQQFVQCHEFLARNTQKLVDLLRQAESRGVLLEESLALVDVGFWLEMIDWQSKFLTLVLNFAKEPNRKSLRPLIELYGRDRDRMRAEAEILERSATPIVTRGIQRDFVSLRPNPCRDRACDGKDAAAVP